MNPIELYFTKDQYDKYGGYIKKNIFKDTFDLKWWYSRQQWSKSKIAVIEYQKNNDDSRLLTITSACSEFIDVMTKIVDHIKLGPVPPIVLDDEVTVPLEEFIVTSITQEIKRHTNINSNVISYMVEHRLRDLNSSAILKDEQ
jgi:hypothetical protein